MKNLVVNPKTDKHYYQWKKAQQRVRIYLGDTLLADSTRSTLIKEQGHDLYDGVYYFPPADVKMDHLQVMPDKVTHCPIKGDSTYYRLEANGQQAEAIAWSYDDPIIGEEVLSGLVAFDAGQVKQVIEPV
jgi:uncharacterized protein (DUF427 family)